MIILYHSPRTRSLRVLWLLEELGVPYELRSMTFTPDVLQSADYLRLSPLGKVPALEDGDVRLFESGAIVEYLVERYDDGRLAPAIGTPARAAYLQWIHFAEGTAIRSDAGRGARSSASCVGSRGRCCGTSCELGAA
jgi:glutathione S-transferase